MATPKIIAEHRAALKFLREADPILGAAIERVGEIEPNAPRTENHFAALARIIAGQQLSTKVAAAIWKRVETHFADFTPETVLRTEIEQLRALDLSGAKARSFHSLAEHIQDGRLKIAALEQLEEAEIRREIIQVKGLGTWSCDMFLMFNLAHPDILPVGDLGIREAVKRLYQLQERP